LEFQPIDPTPYVITDQYTNYKNYGVGVFGTNDSCNFYITFYDNGKCNISYLLDNIYYYLAVDIDNNLFFINEKFLSFSPDTTNPQDFNYVFSESLNSILLFKTTQYGDYILRKDGALLTLRPNIVDYIYDPFTLSRDIYNDTNISLDFSYISYNNNDNYLNLPNSKFNIPSQFLLHKKYVDGDNKLHFILLKNHLTQLDQFSPSNNLLSGFSSNIYVDEFREYTNICSDIQTQESYDLQLNYVFYNQSYIIKPGPNQIKSPEHFYPFINLNINDTKFKYSGSFSYTSPEYADKVFKISDNVTLKDNNQHLLCTWLSGHPEGTEKIWVDRYYYPDVISKEDALLGTPFYDTTYDDYIENLINSNSDIKSALSDVKFFDKLSDFCFEPDTYYVYDRINPLISSNLPLSSTCQQQINQYPYNYFKDINISGAFTLIFNFDGLDNSWEIKSDRNEIDCGLRIVKNGYTLDIYYNIYNPSSEQIEYYQCSTTIKEFKSNILCFSINSISGEGFVYLNNDIIYSFNIIPYKYIKWQLLYGDIFIYENNKKTNLIVFNSTMVTEVSITPTYSTKDYVYLLPIIRGIVPMDDICITLPCGMRNSIDNIEILQDVCNSSIHKSNSIDITIKNIEVDDIYVDELKNFLSSELNIHTPLATEINNLKLKSFK
jgi:hypothetical protein